MAEENGNVTKVYTQPYDNGADNGILTAAMMNNNNMMNNPWAYLVLLGMMNGGFFGGNRGANNDALSIETMNRLNSLQAQMNNNQNSEWLRSALQGNSFAASQLAQNLNVDYNALQSSINGVISAVNTVGANTGMGFAGVSQAISNGNLNIIQQMKDCCCNLRTEVLQQGFQNQLQTVNQTNDILTGVRVENGLTRTEVAAFRQAWENARYQDVVAEKTRLQTELDLLRGQQATTTSLMPLQAEILSMKNKMNALMAGQSLYVQALAGKTTTAVTTGD